MPRVDANQPELKEKLVEIRRVAKTVKGGRRMSFSALVVVGDAAGRVGAGTGKAAEIPEAIRKAIDAAKKNLMTVPLKGTTIPHEALGHWGAGKVLIRPASPGTGVIAGGAVRAVLELAGVRDVLSKSLGSNNANNVVLATLDALRQLRSAEQVARTRGKAVEEIV